MAGQLVTDRAMQEPASGSVRPNAPVAARLSREAAALLLRDVTRRGASASLPVKGCSMYPALRSGDVVTLAPPSPAPVPLGAIVAAEVPSSGGLVVHRLVGRSGGGLVLRGDNASASDTRVPEDALIGVVVAVERGGRTLRPAPAALRLPVALLVRAGVVRRWNELRGPLRRLVRRGRAARSGAAAAPVARAGV